MEIILRQGVKSLKGKFLKDNAYCIRENNGRFFSAKSANCKAQDADHWQFIVMCANMAYSGMYIRDVLVPIDEVIQAHYDWTCPQLKFRKFALKDKRGCRAQICRMIGRDRKVLRCIDVLDLDKVWKKLGYYEQFPID